MQRPADQRRPTSACSGRLPVQPGARPDAGGRVVRAPARADGAEGDAPAPRRPARHAGAGRPGAGRRPLRRHRRGGRALHRGHAHPLRERQAALPPEAAAAARAGSTGCAPRRSRACRPDDPKAAAFRADDRLVKTLLLAALVPEVESLKALTAARLAALNHGTSARPSPGARGRSSSASAAQWAAQVGEIKIGEEPDQPDDRRSRSPASTPRPSSRRPGTTTTSATGGARSASSCSRSSASRTRTSCSCATSSPGAGRSGAVEVVFGNVRELPDESLRAQGTDWKVVIDFPFDAEGHTPADDLARLEQFRSRGEPSRTVCWVPAFFTPRARCGTSAPCVILDHILTGERFRELRAHLSPVDRAAARSLLENQRSQLQQRMHRVPRRRPTASPRRRPGRIDTSHEPGERLQSLDPGFQPRPPVGAQPRRGASAPARPDAGVPVPGASRSSRPTCRPAVLRRVYQEAQRAAQAQDGRIIVERELRPAPAPDRQPAEAGRDARGRLHPRPLLARPLPEEGGGGGRPDQRGEAAALDGGAAAHAACRRTSRTS